VPSSETRSEAQQLLLLLQLLLCLVTMGCLGSPTCMTHTHSHTRTYTYTHTLTLIHTRAHAPPACPALVGPKINTYVNEGVIQWYIVSLTRPTELENEMLIFVDFFLLYFKDTDQI